MYFKVLFKIAWQKVINLNWPHFFVLYSAGVSTCVCFAKLFPQFILTCRHVKYTLSKESPNSLGQLSLQTTWRWNDRPGRELSYDSLECQEARWTMLLLICRSFPLLLNLVVPFKFSCVIMWWIVISIDVGQGFQLQYIQYPAASFEVTGKKKQVESKLTAKLSNCLIYVPLKHFTHNSMNQLILPVQVGRGCSFAYMLLTLKFFLPAQCDDG